MSDYFICTRNNTGTEFGDEPGTATYLSLPDGQDAFTPSHAITQAEFLKSIINNPVEDVVIFVHGYNSSIKDVVERHRHLKSGLAQQGYAGEFISFAWPSGTKPLLYLEDRHDAKTTAFELVNSGIALLAKQQGKNCTVNVHLIAHSTGAYVIHEAFDDAETTREVAEVNWVVSQLLFIAGDVSSAAMDETNAETIYRHCNRFTNYYNPYDEVLAVSNVKRVGARNRVGRIGLPEAVPPKAVDVNCGQYFKDKLGTLNITNGAVSHSWFFYSPQWLKDAAETISGKIDRSFISTRGLDTDHLLYLKSE